MGGTRLVGVAIRYGTGLVCSLPAPHRHCHINDAVYALGAEDSNPPGSVQGFVTNEGVFVDRMEAGRIADENGQANRTPGSRVGGELFSEDIW